MFIYWEKFVVEDFFWVFGGIGVEFIGISFENFLEIWVEVGGVVFLGCFFCV